MKNVLVIGSTGQIGSELTRELRKRYGNDNIVAGFIKGAEPTGELKETGPAAEADVTNPEMLANVVKKHKVDTIYNLAALLSVVAQDTVQRPGTIYGVSKVTTELLSDYYFKKYGVDTRSVRFPGLISYVTPPGGGTTDYAVDIYYAAVRGEEFVCPIKKGTLMDMMYMPDGLHAAISLMEADPSRLKHRNGFNIASMSFDPEKIYQTIKRYKPDFKMVYDVDPLKQGIADSWPDCLDDSAAREEWDWRPQFDLDSMTVDMLKNLEKKLK